MKLKDVFRVEGKLCMIIEMDHLSTFPSFHNGYIEVEDQDDYDFYNSLEDYLPEEITFGEKWNMKGKDSLYFIGFDTVHLQDTPETQNFEAVRKRTILLAKDLIRRGL